MSSQEGAGRETLARHSASGKTFIEWEKRSEGVEGVNPEGLEDGISRYKKFQRLERSLDV